MDFDQIKENLQTQLYELETLQSMFYNPGELRIEDATILEDIKDFLDNKTNIIPSFIDLTINLIVDDLKFEICINLSNEYPQIEPDLFVRNHKFNKKQHTDLNKELNDFLTSLDRGEPCIFTAITWLQDNVNRFITVTETNCCETQPSNNDKLVRYWIYSHHIYSKTKRREILDQAKTLNITGFSMPGKPGIICIEGKSNDCNEWWQIIKSMNWKRIFCKITEECPQNEETNFLKFDTFEEKVFQNASIKNNHMDMGELLKFLESHQCGYIFKDLFGVDAKSGT